MATPANKGSITGRLGAFLVTFVMLFTLAVVFLAAVDALPEEPASTKPVATTTQPSHDIVSTSPTVAENPVRVVATSIGLDTKVVNPTSTNVDILNTALEEGAVRFPTSAQLGVDGTTLLFGHSSYLPIVHHQYYKTFDGIQDLKKGAIISVYSGSHEYRYSVTGVRVANATQDVIELATNGKHLVLVTCNSFTKKTDRFVISADYVGTYSLVSH
jgi:LPXTG-site transpeptidase (sortase) family protein